MANNVINYRPYLLTSFLFFGAMCILLFHEGAHLSISVSASILLLTTACIIKLYRESVVGPLTLLLFVAYALPFIHMFPYIWFDFESEYPLKMWGFVANPYMRDRTVIELMSMMGALGAAGFAIGALLNRKELSVSEVSQVVARQQFSGRTLSLPVFMLWIGLAVAMSWISARSNFIFATDQSNATAIYAQWNFSSSWMFSYAFLVFAFSDALFEISEMVGKLKRYIVLGSILLIVVWFQLLRGDRESLPLVLSVLLMYFAWGKYLAGSAQARISLKWPTVISFTVVVLVASFVVGAVRHSLIGVGNLSEFLNIFSELREAGVIQFQDFVKGTWSAALLTPLSVAGDYINGSFPARYGQDYIDILASIIPGFAADWVGYSRPLDSLHGPAWEMTYGLGGTHAVVLPFINFRMTGVLVIVAVWTYAIGTLERHSLRRLTVSKLSLLGIVALAIPHWLWYGEKYIINALVIWAVLSFAYRFRMPTNGKILFRTI